MMDSIDVEHEVLSTCLFNESNDAFFVFAPEDNCVLDANPAAQRLTRFRRKELIGRELVELFDAHSAGAIDEMIDAYQTTGFFHSKDGYQLRCRDREPLEINISVSRIHTTPSPLGLVVVRDVTQRKLAELALNKVQEDLRRRDAELAHLARVSTVGQMAAELAHEINQPLYAIKNFATAAAAVVTSENKSEHAELAKWIQKIRAQANRAGAVIRHMTRFVRRGNLGRTLADINAVVRGVVALMEARARACETAIQIDLDESLPLVPIQSLLIEQVLVNLIQNSLDAMSETEPDSRRLRIVTKLASPDAIEIVVHDTGSGIDDEPDHLFEPFYTTKPDGIGLGLSICRSTVESHEGRLWATSNPDGGATFHAQLPTKAHHQDLEAFRN